MSTTEYPAIKVKNLSKKFSNNLKRSLFLGTQDLIRNLLGLPSETTKLRKSEFWALNNVSFTIGKGEKVGILGSNGSGKSTLLRLISGIFPPDTGEIVINGNLGSLIAVGAGFHPHMTGRENIYLNGTILGASKQKIDNVFEEIINFAEVENFIDAPVSTYSSGMRVRLGFAIAVHVLPEILLVDEVLAVGDLSFRLKARKKLAEFQEKEGGTFIMVSHNIPMIRNSCERVIWLEKGQIVMDGDPYLVCNSYENAMLNKTNSNDVGGQKIVLDNRIEEFYVTLLNKSDQPIEEVNINETLKIRLNYTVNDKIINPIFNVGIISIEDHVMLETYSNEHMDIKQIDGQGYVELILPRILYKQGTYFISFMLSEEEQIKKVAWYDKTVRFKVISNNQAYKLMHNSMFLHNQEWKHNSN